jgi:hypothetical protein
MASPTSSSWQRWLPWVLLALFSIAFAWQQFGPVEAPAARSLEPSLKSSPVVVITAKELNAPADMSAHDYFVRLGADTWYQFKSDPASTTRFVFKQSAAGEELMTLRDRTRGAEITLTFDFARKTVFYRQADQPQGYPLFAIVSVQALPVP